MAESTGTRAHALTSDEKSGSDQAAKQEAGKHVHHGRTAAAWTGSLLAVVAFILGGIAVVMQNWVLFGISVVVLVVGLVATKVLQVRGHGAL